MNTTISDTELIKLTIAGDSQAYASLVSRYQNYVFTLVMRNVTQREEAEEVAQDVFIKVYRCLRDFRGESKFSTWLYQIVHTTTISHLRSKKNHTIPVEEDRMIAIADSTGQSHSIAHQADKKSEKEVIRKAMELLPETDAQVINLFYLAEQSLEEIGIILGMTPNNVKVRLHRSRLKLKDILQQRFAGEITHA